jgi:hypothetical protein
VEDAILEITANSYMVGETEGMHALKNFVVA